MKFPTMTPSAPFSKPTTKGSVMPIVRKTFARLAQTNANDRSSTRNRAVSCS